MVVLPLSKLPKDFDASPNAPKPPKSDSVHWVRIASAATLIASGALLLSGQRRAGLVAAATGTTLVLLDQKETVKRWWDALPGYIGNTQRILSQVQETVDEIAAQREKLGRVLGRERI
jgi:hypothetical protein